MRTYATLRELVFAKFLVNKFAAPNPVTLPNGNERWYVMPPTNSTIQNSVQKALTDSGLPYHLANLRMYSETGSYVEFKPIADFEATETAARGDARGRG